MVRFTPELLRKFNRKYGWGMCKEGYMTFKEKFPEGIEVSTRGWKRALKSDQINFSWFREHICETQFNRLYSNCICQSSHQKEFLTYLTKMIKDYEKASAAKKKK